MTVNLESVHADQSVWEVSFIDRFARYLVNANTFLEAVEEAKKIAIQKKIPLEDIKSVQYLMY